MLPHISFVVEKELGWFFLTKKLKIKKNTVTVYFFYDAITMLV